MRLLFRICTLLLAAATALPESWATFGGDTLLPADIAYSGYRLHVRDVEVVKEKRGRFLLRCDVVNTGRRPVAMGPGFPVRFLQTAFDESLLAGGLAPLGLALRGALTDSREKFAVGEWREGLEFWVDPTAVPESRELVTDDFERRRVRPRRARAGRESDPKTSIDDATVLASLEPEALSLGDGDADSCVDLAVTTMRVVERGGKRATLAFGITNVGSAPLHVKDLGESLPLDIFLGGAAAISGSSRRVGRVELAERLRDGEGDRLAPGETLALTESINVEAATRYTSVLTARLDGAQVLRECNETNNEASALLEQ